MSSDGTETIELAVTSVENGVGRMLKRRDPSDKSRCRIRCLLEHTKHILMELFRKRRSLKAFLRWFEKEWIRIEIDLEKHPVEILQQSMQHFLRCQDAFILLTSGECRHRYDTKLAKTTKYPSRLSTLQERNDGYTVLYKGSGVYSGYGFDEFNNEIVGVRALLVKELKKYHKAPWDHLERKGATELLESLLDEHERETKELQNSLQSLKGQMIENITKRLKPKNLKFASQDKMERLYLSTKGQTIDLERRADSFQIEGPLLPNKNKRPDDWNYLSFDVKDEVIESSASNPVSTESNSTSKKRRRVIMDSDSEDEMDVPSNKSGKNSTKSSGLVVRIDSSRNQTEKEDSLAAIKTQVGVSTHDLEHAREFLEGENTRTGRIFEEEKVARLEKILNRVLARDDVDDNEVWDARECLRYAYMEAGNKYLWDSGVGCIDKAIDHFEKAKTIVELQQNSQQRVAGGESSVFIRLNLLYLHTQAVINIGISLVDSSHRKLTIPRVKVIRAIEEFQKAKATMAKLRNLAGKATQSSTNAIALEATSYVFKSKQLESLACRWMGRGLWLISEEKKSIESFEEASKLFQDELLQTRVDSLHFESDILEMAAEAIYATCDLADRCYSKMQELGHQSLSSRERGNQMLDVTTRTLNRHIGISGSIERFISADRAKHFRVEYGISSTNDVLSYRDEITKWWIELSNSSAEGQQGFQTKQRSDISSSAQNVMLISGQPSNKSIFSSDGFKRKRHQQKKQSNGPLRSIGRGGRNANDDTTQMDAIHALSSDGLSHQLCQPVKFRKWGDELLMAEQEVAQKREPSISREHGVSPGLILSFPSVAPLMPTEFRKSMQ